MTEPEGVHVATANQPATDGVDLSPVDEEAARRQFRAVVSDAYVAATEPVNLARLSAVVRADLGDLVERTGWFGAASFSRAVAALELPGLAFSQHFMGDETRHERPVAPKSTALGDDATSKLPDAVTRCCAVADLPRLGRTVWPQVFDVLATYAATQPFNLTEATKWT